MIRMLLAAKGIKLSALLAVMAVGLVTAAQSPTAQDTSYVPLILTVCGTVVAVCAMISAVAGVITIYKTQGIHVMLDGQRTALVDNLAKAVADNLTLSKSEAHLQGQVDATKQPIVAETKEPGP